MNIRRTLALTRRLLKQFRHDRRTMAFMVMMPLLMILVFGYTFGGEVSNVKVILVEQDEGATVIIPDPSGGGISQVDIDFGEEIGDNLDRDVLDITTKDELGEAEDIVRDSQFYDKVWAAIYIPKAFSETFVTYLQRLAVSKTLPNQTACEALGLYWHGGACNPQAESEAEDYVKEEACEDAGFVWYSGRCHEDFDDKVKWTETECEAHGYFWYDNRCHDGADIRIVIDATNPNIAAAVNTAMYEAIQNAQKDMMEENPELKVFEVRYPINTINDYAYGSAEIEFIDSFAPAIMAFAMMMVTTMMTIFIFIEERKMGTLDRLLSSPASESEIVIGYAIGFSLVSLVQGTVILVTAIGMFDIYIAEPAFQQVLVAFAFMILMGVGHQCLGILLSSGAKNELQAVQFIPLIIFPSFLLCGFLYPIESIPFFLRPLSYIVPLTYAIDAVRSAMVRGAGIEAMCCHGFALIVFLIIMLLGAIMLLKKRR